MSKGGASSRPEDCHETGSQQQRAGGPVGRQVETLHAKDLVAQNA